MRVCTVCSDLNLLENFGKIIYSINQNASLSVFFDIPYYLTCIKRKPVFGISDQVRHKLCYTTIEAG